MSSESELKTKSSKPYKMEIVWKNVALFVFLHAAMLVGFSYKKKILSLFFGWMIGFAQGLLFQ